jgi:hypothetical protein
MKGRRERPAGRIEHSHASLESTVRVQSLPHMLLVGAFSRRLCGVSSFPHSPATLPLPRTGSRKTHQEPVLEEDLSAIDDSFGRTAGMSPEPAGEGVQARGQNMCRVGTRSSILGTAANDSPVLGIGLVRSNRDTLSLGLHGV